MKIPALFLLLAFLLTNCVATKPPLLECSKFRVGRYGFTKAKVDQWGSHKEVTLRVDSLETIVVLSHIADSKLATLLGSGNSNDTITFGISWIGSCSYKRNFIKSSVRFMDSLLTSIPKISAQYDIISFTDRYYIEQSVADKSRRDTFWIQSSSR
jgi:hypothetical protein